jgi:hypothetical protein
MPIHPQYVLLVGGFQAWCVPLSDFLIGDRDTNAAKKIMLKKTC